MGVISTLTALRGLPALTRRVAALEKRADELELTTGRVSDLEENVEDLEAIAGELYTGKPARTKGAS